METILGFPEIAGEKIADITISQILEHTSKETISKLAEKIISKICDLSLKVLTNKILSISKYDVKMAQFFTVVSNTFNSKGLSKANEISSDILGSTLFIAEFVFSKSFSIHH